jgi:hypothetical protein
MIPVLRRVLRVDAVLSALTGLAMLAAAEPLAGSIGLPVDWTRALGVALLPWAGALAWLASRPAVPRGLVTTVIALNAVWVLDCALAAAGVFASPQGFGVELLIVQAIGTLVLADLEWVGMRRARGGVSVRGGALAG